LLDSAQLSLLYRHKGIKWQMLSQRRDAFLADTGRNMFKTQHSCYRD
jgi:hypothetical protein